MTGKDDAKIHQLPNTDGMKNEVIIQVMQRNFYELMIRLSGAKLVEIGLSNGTQRYHFESAINEKTAAIVHFVAYSPAGDLPIEEVIEVGHKYEVPVIVDAAAEFPPFSALRRWADMGADLTIFSGGKGIRGPQSSGLILGRKDLIEACARNASPNHGVGRPSKIGKEEIAGLVTALELFSIEEFEQAEFDGWQHRTNHMVKILSELPGITAYSESSPSIPAHASIRPPGIPLTHIEWDPDLISKTEDRVVQELNDGDPSIVVKKVENGIQISPSTLQPGEEYIITDRLSQILTAV